MENNAFTKSIALLICSGNDAKFSIAALIGATIWKKHAVVCIPCPESIQFLQGLDL